ncbi:DNA double-strand break repair nuclease NurA [Halalkalibacterium ligniniphilum]|uniref:DNA double-strand break repair nuclease NurA n=1 Tax=Halalkalibacterium ligniniphilum TaxID=1134413 RepID=UPI0003476FA9|nr:DNA double-strand break repair nuclease NurA [Halalkalibacterium ligniniphilum]
MLEIDPELIDKIKKADEKIRQKYDHSTKTRDIIRQKLTESNGVFRQMERWGNQTLSSWLAGREVGAVDGSVNQTKGDPPHVLYFFQALAKTLQGTTCVKTDVYTPLLDEKVEGEEKVEPVKWRAHLLSKLELQAATELITKTNVAILLMDGALYHYRIDAPDQWETLRSLALEKGVLLVGISEEITTQNLVSLSPFSQFLKRPSHYDRDFLFGVLNKGETIYVEDIQQKAGLRSVWMRAGSSPAITGFDMLEEQAKDMNLVADFLYTLTPEEGRGIPLWLDVIDKDVRITDKLVDALVEQYVDPEMKQRFFVRKRQERLY